MRTVAIAFEDLQLHFPRPGGPRVRTELLAWHHRPDANRFERAARQRRLELGLERRQA
jgi:hypothetical protein